MKLTKVPAKVEQIVTERVIEPAKNVLELTDEECRLLRVICGNIAGVGAGREITNKLHEELGKAGFNNTSFGVYDGMRFQGQWN